MITKKGLIGNELLREIIRIRVDALAKMLELQKKDRLPKIYEEGATGDFDNKGAIFVPGGLVLEDSDRHPIRKDKYDRLTRTAFRKLVHNCMQNDNATLLFHDGFLAGVNLDNGFFAEKSSQILGTKWAAGRRPRALEHRPPRKIRSDDICKSLCPEAMSAPYGSRTKLSSCLGENPVGGPGHTRSQEHPAGSALCGRLPPDTLHKPCPRRDDSYSGDRRIRGVCHRHPGGRDRGLR